MSRYGNAVSRIALLVSVASLSAPLPALAVDTTISTTSNTSATTTLNAASSDTLTVTTSGTLSSTANPAVTINVNNATNPISVTNSGTIQDTTSGNRGIRILAAGGASGATPHITITNTSTGIIQSPNDAIQSNPNFTGAGTILIDNSNIIRTTGVGSGQAIDLNNITSTATTVTINNNVNGVISAADADAIRPAAKTVINNYGQIISLNALPTSTGNDGIDYSNSGGTFLTNVTINNYATGTISGARHGITGDTATTITNYGTIVGNDGSGVNIDLIPGPPTPPSGPSATTTTVINHGTIIGTAKTADGDGIDVDYLVNITNDGTIKALGIAGVGNINEALAIGGGTVTNLAGGLIYSDQRAITVDDSNFGNAYAATNINNAGTIWGASGEAIKITSNLSNTLTNSGTIIGSVVMGNATGGNFNTVTINAGSKIVGLVDGGTGTADLLVYNKIGLTAAKEAALQAGQTVNIGGTLYTGFETFTGSTVKSFSSFATNSETAGIAAILDNGSTTQSMSLATQNLIDRVANASDVNAALAQLTPASFQGFGTIGINVASQSGQIIDQRLGNLQSGNAQAFDVAGLNTVAAVVNRDGQPLTGPQVDTLTGMPVAAYAATPSQGDNPALAALAKSANIYKAPAKAIGPDSPWGVFLYGNAMFARQAATATSPQSRFTAGGISAGIDRRVTPDLILGVYGGYVRTNADLDTLGSTSKINTWLLGGYGSYYRQNWFANGAAVYGRNSYDNNRIALGTSNTSSTTGNQYALQSTVGFDIVRGFWAVSPEVGAQYTTVRVNGFTETGIAALAVQSFETNSLRSSLGTRFRYLWLSNWGPVTPEFRAFWQHEFLDKNRDIRANFVDQALPGTFATTVAGAGTDFGVVGAGLTANLAMHTQVSLGYDFKFGGRDFSAHMVSGRLRHTF